MNIQQRITKLEQVTNTTNELPSLIYFTGGTSEYTPDKAKAFIKYKEQWRDDSRYGRVINSLNTPDDLEAYIETNNLPANTIINVVFIGTDVEVMSV
jgi:hypothetical protein